MRIIETYNGTFSKLCVIESKLATARVSQGGNKTLTESANKQELDAAIKIAWEKILTLMLLNGANYNQYSKVRNAPFNQFTLGVYTYLKSIEEAVQLLNN